MTRVERTLVRTAAAIAALLAIAYLTPHVLTVLMLAFAGVVVAVPVDALAGLIRRTAHVPRWLALILTALVIVALIGVLILIVAPHLAEQVPRLAERLPKAWQELLGLLDKYLPLQTLLDKLPPPASMMGGSVLGKLTEVLSNTAAGLFDILVILFIAVYLLADPQRYRELALQVAPAGHRDTGRELADQIGREIRHWILGRLTSMTIVGILTAAGLWLLGVPLALTLGLLAGVLSFVPYLGPVLALVPAVLVAAGESMGLVGWTVGLYVVIQTLESYLLTPLIQQRAVALPPAVLVVGQLLGGVLTGPLGVLFAAPILVVIGTCVRFMGDGTRAGVIRAE